MTGVECEIKLRYASLEDARRAVASIGARPLRPRRLQDDLILDGDDGRLQAEGCLLRVRRDGAAAAVTWKGPVVESDLKVRREVESAVSSAQALEEIFGALGLRPRFRYQKYREEFDLDGLIVAVDDTPVGVFVELEGDDGAVRAAAARLGRPPADYLRASYRTIFLEHRARHGGAGEHMVFRDA